VVEPSQRSLDSAHRVDKLARDIGIKNIAVVGNKIRSPKDREFLTSRLPSFDFLGFIPYDQAIIEADLANLSPVDASQGIKNEVRHIYQTLTANSGSNKVKETG
jgi:CO dehydrogenase maturation factor